MGGALWPGPLPRPLALLQIHVSELSEACLEGGGQSASGGGGFLGEWFQWEGGRSFPVKVSGWCKAGL